MSRRLLPSVLFVAWSAACGSRESLGSRTQRDGSTAGTTSGIPSDGGFTSGAQTASEVGGAPEGDALARPDAPASDANLPVDLGTSDADGRRSCPVDSALSPESRYVLLVLESSDRMRLPLTTSATRWEGVTEVLAAELAKLPSYVSLGMQAFPYAGVGSPPVPPRCTEDCCRQSVDLSSIQVPNGPPGTGRTEIAATLASLQPAGGAPLGTALQVVDEYFLQGPRSQVVGSRHVVLVIAGSGHCSNRVDLSCGPEQCTSNLEGSPSCDATPRDAGAPVVNCCAPGYPPFGVAGCADDEAVRTQLTFLVQQGVSVTIVALPSADAYGGRLASYPAGTGPRFRQVPDGENLSGTVAESLRYLAEECRYQLPEPLPLVPPQVWIDGNPLSPAEFSVEFEVQRPLIGALVLGSAACDALRTSGPHEVRMQYDNCSVGGP